MSVERPGFEDVARRRERLHDLGAATDGSDRESAADNLRKRREIWFYVVLALCTLQAADSEPGDDLVKDQQRTVVVTEITERLVIALDRQNDSVISQKWFGEDGCNLRAVVLEDIADRVLVVEQDRDCLLGERGRDTSTTRFLLDRKSVV